MMSKEHMICSNRYHHSEHWKFRETVEQNNLLRSSAIVAHPQLYYTQLFEPGPHFLKSMSEPGSVAYYSYCQFLQHVVSGGCIPQLDHRRQNLANLQQLCPKSSAREPGNHLQHPAAINTLPAMETAGEVRKQLTAPYSAAELGEPCIPYLHPVKTSVRSCDAAMYSASNQQPDSYAACIARVVPENSKTDDDCRIRSGLEPKQQNGNMGNIRLAAQRYVSNLINALSLLLFLPHTH